MIQRGNGRSMSRGATPSRLPVEPAARVAVPKKEAWVLRTEAWIAQHPLVSIAAAVTLGATLGWLIKRR